MNKLIIIGNLTANPECRLVDTANGQQKVCNYTIAVNRYSRNQKVTEYFRASTWNKQADNDMQYLTKGSKVAITGPVSARAYASNDGTLRASMEVFVETIEYLSSGKREETAAPGQAQGQPQQQSGYQQQSFGQSAPPSDPAYQEGFMDIPEGMENEGLPFN